MDNEKITKETISDTESMEIIKDDDGKCCKIIPKWFWRELKLVLKLAWPMVLTAELQFGLTTVSLIFAGTLGTTEQGGIALANSLYNVTSLSVSSGVTTACDTFFSQTYGSGNKKKVGVQLQKSILISTLICFPIWALLVNAEQILLHLGQEPVIARITGNFLLILLPAVWIEFLFRIQQKYLANQNNVIPLLCICICGIVVSVAINYGLVIVMELGPSGVALASLLGTTTFCILTLLYIIISKAYKETWGGFSMECFLDWGSFATVAIAGLFMIFFEWMGFEIGVILAGYIGETELASVAILIQMQTMINLMYILTSVACGIRLGQELGKGDAENARRVCKITLVVSVCISTIIAIIITTMNDILPSIFTKDPAVHKMVSENLLLLVFYFFLGGISVSHAGLIRGSGRQRQGAITIFIGFYMLGLPTGIPLMLLTPLKIAGFWIGLTMAELFVGIVYVTVIYRTDWEKQVKNAQIRAGADLAAKMENNGYEETNVDEENETSSLLRNNTRTYGKEKSLSKNKNTPVTCKLLLKRLLTTICIASVLAASILIKIFVPVPDIPGTNCDFSGNGTLPAECYLDNFNDTISVDSTVKYAIK